MEQQHEFTQGQASFNPFLPDDYQGKEKEEMSSSNSNSIVVEKTQDPEKPIPNKQDQATVRVLSESMKMMEETFAMAQQRLEEARKQRAATKRAVMNNEPLVVPPHPLKINMIFSALKYLAPAGVICWGLYRLYCWWNGKKAPELPVAVEDPS